MKDINCFVFVLIIEGTYENTHQKSCRNLIMYNDIMAASVELICSKNASANYGKSLLYGNYTIMQRYRWRGTYHHTRKILK